MTRFSTTANNIKNRKWNQFVSARCLAQIGIHKEQRRNEEYHG